MLKDPLAKFVISLTILTFFIASLVPVHTERYPTKRYLPTYCTKGCQTYGIPKSLEKVYLYECHYNENGVLETVSENGEMICGVESNGLFTVRGIEGDYSTYSTSDF
tara:strand:- start:3388 stop:3708 length:321 start_codon:yes stop_codon:yes gene_type:complete